MSADPYSQKRFVKDPSHMAQQVVDEVVLVPLQPAPGRPHASYVMNFTAGEVWDLIDGERCISDIADHFAGEYQITSDQAEADLIALFQHLENIGAVRAV